MSITGEEIASQPDLWPLAAALAGEHTALLPETGTRVGVIG